MDLLIVLVVGGCAVLGMMWGAVRMATLVAAIAAGVLAGRWAGPGAAQLVGGTTAQSGSGRTLAIAAVALAAAILVWLAGKGLRRALKALHLGWVDRLAGLVAGAGAAALVLALLLGLAAMGGHGPSSPWATRLAQAGQTFLAVQSFSASKASPSKTPSIPTSSGQHPR
ncbi:MAG: CvpA family protein [Acidobacteriia bacterium]|nr:CvpA family protein [Terriglobia bacterium]